MNWDEALEYAKEELGVYGYVDSDHWNDVVDLAKSICKDDFHECVLAEYNKHINSRSWFVLRKEILKRDGTKCFDCGNIATTVHHLSYSHLGTIKEKNDCISLCHRCHSSRHTQGYPFKNSRHWISKSIDGFYTVFFCSYCNVQRTFHSIPGNNIIFRCDHCGGSKIYSNENKGFD